VKCDKFVSIRPKDKFYSKRLNIAINNATVKIQNKTITEMQIDATVYQNIENSQTG